MLSFVLICSFFTGVVYAASGDTIVYRTKTGDKYHTKTCSYLKSSIELTLQEAVNMGLTPCSRCKPPTLDSSSNSTSSNRSSTAPASNTTRSSTSGTKSTVYGSGTQFEVTIKATCSNYNHVGNEWKKEYSVAGYEIKSGDIVAFNEKDKLKIITTITELDDSSDDIGEAKTTHKVTKEDIKDGFTITQTITVTENGGRYKGNTAAWEVEYTFIRK